MMVKKSNKKYFIKEEDNIYVVYEEFFDEIRNRESALAYYIRTYGEIHSVLKSECKNKEILYIGNMKIITGLQRTLEELEKRWPFLSIEFRAVPRRINGCLLFTC